MSQPQYPPLCILCGELALAKTDKNGKPFVACTSCGTYHFLRTVKAEVGYYVAQELVRANLPVFLAQLQDGYMSRVTAIQMGHEPSPSAQPKKRRKKRK